MPYMVLEMLELKELTNAQMTNDSIRSIAIDFELSSKMRIITFREFDFTSIRASSDGFQFR
jgi:hypothetical protein